MCAWGRATGRDVSGQWKGDSVKSSDIDLLGKVGEEMRRVVVYLAQMAGKVEEVAVRLGVREPKGPEVTLERPERPSRKERKVERGSYSKKSGTLQCKKCHRVFQTGQALGPHQRWCKGEG